MSIFTIELKTTPKDFEKQARALLIAQGKDPDQREQYPDPNGYAVARFRAAWVNVAHELYDHYIKMKLVQHYERSRR